MMQHTKCQDFASFRLQQPTTYRSSFLGYQVLNPFSIFPRVSGLPPSTFVRPEPEPSRLHHTERILPLASDSHKVFILTCRGPAELQDITVFSCLAELFPLQQHHTRGLSPTHTYNWSMSSASPRRSSFSYFCFVRSIRLLKWR